MFSRHVHEVTHYETHCPKFGEPMCIIAFAVSGGNSGSTGRSRPRTGRRWTRRRGRAKAWSDPWVQLTRMRRRMRVSAVDGGVCTRRMAIKPTAADAHPDSGPTVAIHGYSVREKLAPAQVSRNCDSFFDNAAPSVRGRAASRRSGPKSRPRQPMAWPDTFLTAVPEGPISRAPSGGTRCGPRRRNRCSRGGTGKRRTRPAGRWRPCRPRCARDARRAVLRPPVHAPRCPAGR